MDKKTKTYNSDQISIKDLLHYGRDHLIVARYLFEINLLKCVESNDRFLVTTLDSAGYLAHLAIESFLKAGCLFENNSFEATHDLNDLVECVRFISNKMTKEHREQIKEINKFQWLRFPSEIGCSKTSIGSEDCEMVVNLVDVIIKAMPDDLYKIYCQLEDLGKGGRILMAKEK